MCIGHRLTRSRVDNSQAHVSLWQRLHQQGDIRHVEIIVDGVEPLVVGDVIDEIHAGGHALHPYRVGKLLKGFVRRVVLIDQHLVRAGHTILTDHPTIDIIRQRVLHLLADIHLRDLHLQMIHALQLRESHQLTFSRQHILITLDYLEQWTGHLLQMILQHSTSVVVLPSCYRCLQEVVLLLIGDILAMIHDPVSEDRCLTTLGHVTVETDQGVDAGDQRNLRLFPIKRIRYILLDGLEGSHQRRLLALGLFVVTVAHHLRATGLTGNDTQQVMVVEISIFPLDNQWLIPFRLCLTQQQRVGKGDIKILVG